MTPFPVVGAPRLVQWSTRTEFPVQDRSKRKIVMDSKETWVVQVVVEVVAEHVRVLRVLQPYDHFVEQQVIQRSYS